MFLLPPDGQKIAGDVSRSTTFVDQSLKLRKGKVVFF
jgi:hypothetical protein